MATLGILKRKDPDEDLDYTWDFGAVLGTGESIASYSFEDVPAALTLHDESNNSTAVTAYVGPGGTVGTKYTVTCRVVTDAAIPRTFDRSITFHMITK